MIVVKILLAICAFFLIIFITKTFSNGMRCRINKARISNNSTIYNHKMYSNLFLILIIITLFLAAISLQVKILAESETEIFIIHAISLIIFLSLFLSIRLHFNGIEYPTLHKFLTYPCLLSFLFMLTSGMIMLWHL